MNTSLRLGRASGVAFAIGVSTGSLFWGSLAALGLGAVLTQYAELATALRIAGGLYFLHLAYKLLKASKAGGSLPNAPTATTNTLARQYGSGVLLHLLNPKCIKSLSTRGALD